MAIDTQDQRAAILKRLSKAKHDNSAGIEASGSVVLQKKLHQKSPSELTEYFCRILRAHNTSIHSISSITDLPQAVAEYLHSLFVPPVLYGGDNPMLNTLAWINAGIQWQEESFTSDGLVAIAEAECAIAETGTVVVLSDQKNPTRNNFLAEHHIVLLRQQNIKAYSEDVWAHINDSYSSLPRAINFISGPSSSADVGLKLEYGAHGPRTLAVFIVES